MVNCLTDLGQVAMGWSSCGFLKVILQFKFTNFEVLMFLISCTCIKTNIKILSELSDFIAAAVVNY